MCNIKVKKGLLKMHTFADIWGEFIHYLPCLFLTLGYLQELAGLGLIRWLAGWLGG